MNRFSLGSFVAGAVLAASLTVGGLALAHSEGGGMMGGGGMMSQMQEMMSKCNAMMDKMDGHMGEEGPSAPDTNSEPSS